MYQITGPCVPKKYKLDVGGSRGKIWVLLFFGQKVAMSNQRRRRWGDRMVFDSFFIQIVGFVVFFFSILLLLLLCMVGDGWMDGWMAESCSCFFCSRWEGGWSSVEGVVCRAKAHLQKHGEKEEGEKGGKREGKAKETSIIRLGAFFILARKEEGTGEFSFQVFFSIFIEVFLCL